MEIIEDVSRLCSMCRDLGYIGALANEYYHDSTGSDMADKICEYMTELFNAKRELKTITGKPVSEEDWRLP